MFEVEVSVPLRFRHHIEGFGKQYEIEHEHTWNIQLTTKTQNLDKRGVSVDFVKLKENLDVILTPFQDKLLNNHPPFDRIQPTAEHIAEWVATLMTEKYPGLLKDVAVGTEQEKARFILP